MDVIIDKNGAIWTIILNRPDRKNAVDRRMADQLANAFREFEAESEAAIAVLWGAGGCFCAGADLKAVALGQGNRLSYDMSKDGPMGPTRMYLSKPVIAAVSGFAVAGGLELACWCDLRVMEKDAIFGVYCRRYGVPLVDGGTQRLPRLIGISRAMDMILTGRSVSADEALAIGLANYVVETGQSRKEAEEIALRIAQHPSRCLKSDREALYRGFDLPFAQAMELEFRSGMQVIESGETKEGAARFAERKVRDKFHSPGETLNNG
ncbi:MAG: crotonase/enoyl-CoA hydratase family protein [Deltaproteobacteria bacterium]|nr:crotonase/enoyl-CoA hydratase family protein [Deltaproteobacteria bacterium]